MKALQKFNRIATALSVLVVIGIANSASAYYVEDIDSNYSAGDLMDKVGNPGSWQLGSFRGYALAAAHEATVYSTSATNRRPDGLLAVGGGGDPGWSGGRSLLGDVAADGSYTLVVDAFPAGGSQNRLLIGSTGAAIGGSDIANVIHVELNRNNNPMVTFENALDGSQNVNLFENDIEAMRANIFDDDDNSANGEQTGWVQMRLSVDDVNAATKSVTLDLRALGDASWNTLGTITNYTGPIEAFHVNMQAGARMDNITSGVIPEPASLSLLAAGGLLMLLRRRRRA